MKNAKVVINSKNETDENQHKSGFSRAQRAPHGTDSIKLLI